MLYICKDIWIISSLFYDLRAQGHIRGLEGVNLDSKFLDLFNVKYVLSHRDLRTNLDLWIIKENNWGDIQAINLYQTVQRVPISGPTFSLNLIVPLDTRYLKFSTLSLDAMVPSKKVVIRVRRGKEILFSKKIGNSLSWHTLGLERFRGKTIALSFETFPPEAKVRWANFHFSNGGDLRKKFKLVYDKKIDSYPIRIYRNKKVLPRFFMVSQVVYESEPSKVLETMREVNLKKTAVLEERTTLKGAEDLDYRIKIKKYESQYSSLQVSSNKKGFLFFGDSFYPGWRAWVNGKPAKVFRANFLFKGIFLAPGKNRVEFKYQPLSFRLGSIVSILSLGSFILLMFGEKYFLRKRSH